MGELKTILLDGVAAREDADFCENAEQADLILLDFRHLLHDYYRIDRPEKTVIVDYRDQPQHVFPDNARLYFKRSVVRSQRDGWMHYEREITPIAYCVKDAYANLRHRWPVERDIDIAVFFRPEDPVTARNRYRSLLARTIASQFSHLKTFVGIAGSSGEAGRSGFQPDYFATMSRARIVATCNPDHMEGDYRLFEALSSGALVLCDRMRTPVTSPFIDHRHLVYYARDNPETLIGWLNFYLENENRRRAVAQAGYEHAMAHHTAYHRIGEILERAAAAGLGDRP